MGRQEDALYIKIANLLYFFQEEDREREIENDRIEQQRINNLKLDEKEIIDDSINKIRYTSSI